MQSTPEQNLRTQLAIVPEDSFLHFKLAKLLTPHQPHEAIQHYQTALQLKPHYPEALRNLAQLLFTQKNYPDALALLHTAVQLDPADLQSLSALGIMLTDTKHPESALPFLRQALRLAPAEPTLHNSLALALQNLGRLQDAEHSFLTALHLKPTFIPAHNNLGILYITLHRTDEALSSFHLAAALDPHDIHTKCNRALALLQAGDYTNGWQQFDHRWSRPETPHRSFPNHAPLWNRQPLTNKTIYLHTDQGLGDRIQFIRYAPLLKSLGATILVETPSPLAKILNRALAVDQIIQEHDPFPHFDFHSDLTRLPFLFNTTLETIPNTFPYLTPEPDRTAHWKNYLNQHTSAKTLRVGLYWQGNPHHQNDAFRSLPLHLLQPLTLLPHLTLLSLQRGPGTDQIPPFNRLHQHKLLTPFDGHQSSPDHLADSAALIQNLDLILTVDTATAHLAGALHKPTYVLLSAISDYRWLSQRPDSPWYPSLHLFRQSELNHWHSPISQITALLQQTPPPSTVSRLPSTQKIPNFP